MNKAGQPHPLVVLARLAIVSHLSGDPPPSTEIPGDPAGAAGAFVSLKKAGQLRGCIGTISPVQPDVAREVLENAVSAATKDPRFPPVTLDEVDDITISVDVLGAPEPVSGLEELDPQRYGVIVKCGLRKGLLLPDLPGITTAEEQVRIARLKAGIGTEEVVELFRFEVERYT
ncbi:MAG: AmmeMemoRadiSam system protein A [bacterium]|nr:MAG: AmmeMemoRadiSam system protein A [bacterium]